jgi:hypothetical protein
VAVTAITERGLANLFELSLSYLRLAGARLDMKKDGNGLN